MRPPAPTHVDVATLPVEERVSLLFVAGMPIAQIAAQESLDTATVEVALRDMLQHLADRIQGFQADLDAVATSLHSEHLRLATPSLGDLRTGDDFHFDRGACATYLEAAQDVQDVLNFQRRATTRHTSKKARS